MAWIGILTAGVTASWLGCSSSSNTGTATTQGSGGAPTTTSTGTKSGTGGTKASTSSVSSGTSVGGAGGAGGGNAGTGIQCNPVTNAPCSSDEQCDTNFDGAGDIIGFVCWPSNNVALCAMCDPGNNLACAPSGTCFIYDNNGDSACTQYCCTDADCGSGGTCQTGYMGTPYFAPLAPNLGICVLASSTGTGGSGTGGSGTGGSGTGGSGTDGGVADAGTGTGTGAGGGTTSDPYVCMVPGTPPSGGSCVTVGM